MFGGVVELTPDEMKRSFGTESKTDEIGIDKGKLETEKSETKSGLLSNEPEGFDVIENSIEI